MFYLLPSRQSLVVLLDNPHLLLLPRRRRARSTGGLPRFQPLEPLKLSRK